MKKFLVLISFAMIGSQSVAMNPDSRWERETYGSSKEQMKMEERNQQSNIKHGSQAAGRGQNLYAIIGVSQDATTSEISSAYRKKARQLKKAEKWEQMKNLNHAKDILTDPKARAAYDSANQ